MEKKGESKKPRSNLPLLVLLLLAFLVGSLYYTAPGYFEAAWQRVGSLFRTEPPRKQVALLQLKSSPPDAQVQINGELRGKTPLELELPLGRYTVRASLPGHADWSEEVSLDEARQYPLQMELRRPAELAFVKFDSKPPGAQVFVNGTPEGKTPVGLELPLGDHSVRMALSGFKDWEQKITLQEDKEYPVSAELTPTAEAKLATLKVDTTPAGVAIYVNDELRGRSPLEVSLPLGKYLVRMRLDGYMDWVEVVQLGEERRYPLSVDLKPVQTLAVLNVTTVPPGADVTVDGRLEGKSPVTLRLTAGKKTVRISLDGYQEWSDTVLLQEARDTPLEINLKQAARESELAINSNPPGAQVYVDETPKGVTPLRVKASPGKHAVRLTLANHQEWEGKVQVEEGKEHPLNVDLKFLSRDALLSVMSEPPRAKVFINGVAKGETPLQLKLPPGKHDVRMTLSKFRDWESQVQLKAAEEYPLNVRMAPEPPRRQSPPKPRQPTTEDTTGRTQPKPPATEDWGVGEWRSRRLNQGQ
ncbi:MAG: PEGA domain-containing protein [Syntrophobacteraceae bacterium]|nr:PEGA domain-containing protein [Syntrophobacteraceae bacterium]